MALVGNSGGLIFSSNNELSKISSEKGAVGSFVAEVLPGRINTRRVKQEM